MTWGAIGGAAVSVVGGALLSKKNKGSSDAGAQAQQGAQAANQQSWSDIDRVNALNRENATWTQQQNQAANDRNMIDSSNAWGSVSRERDPVTGQLKQTSSLAGPWGDIVNQGANQYGAMQGNLSADQFGINSDVFKAIQGLSNPQLATQRNRENARLAAMGLGTGSGQAWMNAQDTLNNSENDMFNRNVLSGNQAWLAGQGNLRQNMGAIMSGQQGIKGLAGQDAWAQATTPQMTQSTVAQPENRTWEAAQLGIQGNQADQLNKYNNMAGMVGAIGNLAGNKDVWKGVSDWWNTPSSGGGQSTVGTPDYNAWQNQGNYGWGSGEL